MVEAKPYKLICKVQNYDWGTVNENAYIPKLTGIEPEKDKPYAELWIGSHPKASSEIMIDGINHSLNDIIKQYPEAVLGEKIIAKFGNNLPYLLKVLSASKALSIQTHPNKEQAKILHSADPDNYPDSNHKPEIAVAIDGLKAIAGFRPVNEIIDNIKEHPEIFELADQELVSHIINADELILKESLIKELYSVIMRRSRDNEAIAGAVAKIAERLSSNKKLRDEEKQFLIQYKNFGADVGLLSLFFLNIIELRPWQAIFTEAGIPHAYLEGNIVECMANSDNVVRAGLTNKFKDVDTLLDILRYEFKSYNILNDEAEAKDVVYQTSAEEFELHLMNKNMGFTSEITTGDKPVIIFVIEGELNIETFADGVSALEKANKGEAVLLPALIRNYKLSSATNTKFFIVRIPD